MSDISESVKWKCMFLVGEEAKHEIKYRRLDNETVELVTQNGTITLGSDSEEDEEDVFNVQTDRNN